jgi:Domain of unknown function (DUF4158)
MPWRAVLTAAERSALLAFPTDPDELIRHYSFDERDLTRIRRHRGGHNRLGFAVQLCCLRFPGIPLAPEATPPDPLLDWVARQLQVDSGAWARYPRRAETRREHRHELYTWLGLTPFGVRQFRTSVQQLTELAAQTDRGMVLATALVERLRQQSVLLPPLRVIERICASARSRGIQRVYGALTEPLTAGQREALDRLLEPHDATPQSTLTWLRQPPGFPNAKHILEHLTRLRTLRALELPDDRLEQAVHHNRLLKLAREGAAMTAQHLRDLEPRRRHATLVAVVLDTRATVTDESIDLHDRIMGTLFNRAKRTHAEQFQQAGHTLHDTIRLFCTVGQALLAARTSGHDPFAAIETVVPWDVFAARVADAEQLARPERFDFLGQLGSGYGQLRRYTPTLLETLELKAAPAAQELLEAVETLKTLNATKARKVPEDAPTGFVRVGRYPFERYDKASY